MFACWRALRSRDMRRAESEATRFRVRRAAPGSTIHVHGLSLGHPSETLLARRALAVVRATERTQVGPYQSQLGVVANAADVIDIARCGSASRDAADRVGLDELTTQRAPCFVVASTRCARPLGVGNPSTLGLGLGPRLGPRWTVQWRLGRHGMVSAARSHCRAAVAVGGATSRRPRAAGVAFRRCLCSEDSAALLFRSVIASTLAWMVRRSWLPSAHAARRAVLTIPAPGSPIRAARQRGTAGRAGTSTPGRGRRDRGRRRRASS